MSYTALYRKYRPQYFREVIGQDAITKTLQNSIISNKVGHAYLFCGPRGTGKTSVARIFAKAINCNSLENGEPCGNCISCNEITESMSPDVIEIDAASNNGVDEIRDIREKVKFLPSGIKKKIYIIDEVHMLSTGAFNALLKTLEEPPSHVVFILATTEVQKLPATIISRCQRFDFKPIDACDISVKLKQVCEAEEVNATDEAINTISEAADGGLRDALSVLDQVISYGNKEITIEDVNAITGTISLEKMISLIKYIDKKDVNSSLEIINDFIVNGKEISKIISAMVVLCRDLLLYKSIGNKNNNKYLFDKQTFQEAAFDISSNKILYYIDILCDAQNKIKSSTTPTIYLELAIIKMCNISEADLDLVKRVTDVEEKINNLDFTDISAGSISNEKIDILETKLNQVVTEFNKLGLHTLNQRIEDLSETVSNRLNEDAEKNIVANLASQIDSIKANIAQIKNDSLVGANANVDLNEIKNSLIQEQNNNSKNYDSEIGDLNDKLKDLFSQIESIKSGMNNADLNESNSNDFENELNELKEKVTLLIDSQTDSNEKISEQIIDEKIQKAIQYFDNQKTYNEDDVPINDKYSELNNKLLQLEAELNNAKQSKQESVNLESNTYSEDQLEFILKQVNDLREQFAQYKDVLRNYDSNEIKLIKEKLDSLEKQSLLVKKENKVEKIETKQPSLFDETKEDSKPKEKFDFGNLEKEQPNELFNFDKEEKALTKDIVVDTSSESYFNVEKKEQVITNPNSSIVIREKEEKEPVYNSTLINNEYREERKQEQEKPSIQLVQEEIKSFEDEDVLARYNIHDLERIMNEALDSKNKNERNRLIEVWKTLDRGIDPDLSVVAQTLQEGSIAVVGNREIVLSFPSISTCNTVMRSKFKKDAFNIMMSKLGEKYNYLALPNDVWGKKRQEFVSQYQAGIKNFKLSDYNIPGLNIIGDKEEFVNNEDKAIQKIVNLFGKDIVKIEEN